MEVQRYTRQVRSSIDSYKLTEENLRLSQTHECTSCEMVTGANLHDILILIRAMKESHAKYVQGRWAT